MTDEEIERLQSKVWEQAKAQGLEDGDVLLPLTTAQREQATASLLGKVSVPLLFGTSNRAIRRAAQKLDSRSDSRDKRSPKSGWIEMYIRSGIPSADLATDRLDTVLLAVLLLAILSAFVLEGWRIALSTSGVIVIVVIRAIIRRRERDRHRDGNRREN